MKKYCNGINTRFMKENLITALLEYGLNEADLQKMSIFQLEKLFYVNFFADKGEDRTELESADIEDLRMQFQMYDDVTFVNPNKGCE